MIHPPLPVGAPNPPLEDLMPLSFRPSALLGLLAFSVIPAQAAVTPTPTAAPLTAAGIVLVSMIWVEDVLGKTGASIRGQDT